MYKLDSEVVILKYVKKYYENQKMKKYLKKERYNNVFYVCYIQKL